MHGYTGKAILTTVLQYWLQWQKDYAITSLSIQCSVILKFTVLTHVFIIFTQLNTHILLQRE